MDITIEKAEESWNMGLAITYDGDNHSIVYATTCNRCDEYFESEKIGVYCDKCIEEWKERNVNNGRLAI